MFTLTLDAADFMSDADAGVRELTHDTHNAAANAADEGVKAEQADHPYTDRTQNLTGSAHVEPAGDGEGFDMVWPAEYASFVDGRGYDVNADPSGKYKFTPIAEKRAGNVLDYDLANAVDAFKDKLSG